MKIKILFIIILFSGILSNGKAQSENVPKLVVIELFKAAKTANYSLLVNLCDPLGQCDGDSKSICNLINANQEAQLQFCEQFKKGRIVGKTIIKNDFAKVKIKFGKNGKKDEVIVLVKREGKWFLYSF